MRSPDQLDNGADDGVDVAITLLEPIEERFPLLADPDLLYQVYIDLFFRSNINPSLFVRNEHVYVCLILFVYFFNCLPHRSWIGFS